MKMVIFIFFVVGVCLELLYVMWNIVLEMMMFFWIVFFV